MSIYKVESLICMWRLLHNLHFLKPLDKGLFASWRLPWCRRWSFYTWVRWGLQGKRKLRIYISSSPRTRRQCIPQLGDFSSEHNSATLCTTPRNSSHRRSSQNPLEHSSLRKYTHPSILGQFLALSQQPSQTQYHHNKCNSWSTPTSHQNSIQLSILFWGFLWSIWVSPSENEGNIQPFNFLEVFFEIHKYDVYIQKVKNFNFLLRFSLKLYHIKYK